ncbi:MAG: pyridoxal phosphate-dependent aminotransferase [Phycisphaerales bacterium]|nr:pyridoxal phosphate-dependent aminotransferase [Phycisphaerales bacterium]
MIQAPPQPTRTAPLPAAAVFRDLPFMGVIRVNNEAARVGYRMGDPSWSNLGQGQPEVGELPGAPARFSDLKIDLADHAYGPVEGLPDLRAAIAAHYNRLYRVGMKSQYTEQNIAVAAGGRMALSRLAASMKHARLGHFTPDYTAYEDLLTSFPTIDPVQIDLSPASGFTITPEALGDRVGRDRLDALLISNPCNPTGVVISGEELRAWVELSRTRGTTLLMDEFYSHYHYTADGKPASAGVSAAEFIDDVNSDRVVVIDGLTKCFRYPGWRIGWVVAPTDIIQRMTAAGSFLDGGPCRPMQRAAIEVLKPARADQELAAVRAEFAEKRRITIERLSALGVKFHHPASRHSGTFYIYGDVSSLPGPLSTGQGFMREAFKHRVLTVPGEFFDVNPGTKRQADPGLCRFVRFSFGPPRANLTAGLDRLADMVKASQ